MFDEPSVEMVKPPAMAKSSLMICTVKSLMVMFLGWVVWRGCGVIGVAEVRSGRRRRLAVLRRLVVRGKCILLGCGEGLRIG